jgi:LytS/YehU family sensor histidine kinase
MMTPEPLKGPETVPYVSMPPLLFVSLVENAFKHGILASGRSFVHILINLEEDFLNFNIKNSRNDKSGHHAGIEKIGLNNVRRRLDLIYGKKYTFEVKESANSFEVSVKIPLHENPVPGH